MQKIPYMKPRERFLAALCGKQFDVYPVASITSTANREGMAKTKCFFPEAHIKSYDMAALSSFAHDEYGFDSVAPYFSLHLEASRFGAEVDWGNEYSMPRIISSPKPMLEDLKCNDKFFTQGITKELLTAIKSISKRYQGRVAIVGKVVGPWTLMYHLYGVENVLLDSIVEPELVKARLGKLIDFSIRFASLQFSEGADAVVWADHVTSDLVSRGLYERLLFPFHKRAVEELGVDKPLILHVCGNVEAKFGLFEKAGFAAFHADSRNDIKTLSAMREKMVLIGSVNNPKTLLGFVPNYVKAEGLKNIKDGVDILSPECAIPTSVPGVNLKALSEAGHGTRPKITTTT